MTLPPNELARVRNTSGAPLAWRIKRLLWSVVDSSLYRYSFHTWSGWRCMLLRMFGAKIGKDCIIRRTCRVHYPWKLAIGDLCWLGDFTEVYNLDMVTIGQRVVISQEAYVCAGTHDYTQLSMPLVTKPVVIKDDAWICARAFINAGLTVGQGAIVGAGAVVVKDVADWTIMGGNPARFIKVRPRPG